MDAQMLKAADIITFCRIILSPSLLFFSPLSVPFGVTYLLCGLSDTADGIVARKTHTESKTGAKLDSIADAMFLTVSAVKLLPLMRLRSWIWVWVAVIAVIKTVGILLRFSEHRSFTVPHSVANKLTGALLFILPLSIPLIDIQYSAAVVCTAATFAAVDDLRSERKE